MSSLGTSFSAEGLVSKGSDEVDARVDMTAMIDLVFMLNIFFLVTSLVTALAELDLPFATHVSAADMETATLISVTAKAKGDHPSVYIGDVETGELIPDPQVEDRIAAAVQQGVQLGKKNVIVKAEKYVPLSMDARIGAGVAAGSEEVKLNFAVMEKD